MVPPIGSGRRSIQSREVVREEVLGATIHVVSSFNIGLHVTDARVSGGCWIKCTYGNELQGKRTMPFRIDKTKAYRPPPLRRQEVDGNNETTSNNCIIQSTTKSTESRNNVGQPRQHTTKKMDNGCVHLTRNATYTTTRTTAENQTDIISRLVLVFEVTIQGRIRRSQSFGGPIYVVTKYRHTKAFKSVVRVGQGQGKRCEGLIIESVLESMQSLCRNFTSAQVPQSQLLEVCNVYKYFSGFGSI